MTKLEEAGDGWKAHLAEDVARYGPILREIEVEEEKQLHRAVSISRLGFVNSILRHFCT